MLDTLVHSTAFKVFLYVAMAYLTYVSLKMIWKIIIGDKYVRYLSSIELLATTYGLGFTLKLTHIGPTFVRWHLADLGFTAALAGFLIAPTHHMWRLEFTSELTSARLQVRHDMARTYRKLLWFATLLAIAYEYFAGWGVEVLRARGQADDLLIGAFDSVDVAYYVAGSALAYWLVTKLRQCLEQPLADALQAEAELEQAKKRLQRRQPRKKSSRKVERDVI